MTDPELAALESRLAPVTAAGSSREYRREVEALLAECRRLRRPPDVSGLMPAAGLESLRAKVCPFGPGTLPAWIPALFRHTDAQAAYMRQLEGVVADAYESAEAALGEDAR